MWRKIIFCSFLLSLGLAYSCESLEVVESNTGKLAIVLQKNTLTKAVIREMPDSNQFIISIKNSEGKVLYSGTYGLRPKELLLPAGIYEASIVSRVFSQPEFDAPLYSDNRAFIVERGKLTVLSLICKQTNSAVRVGFSRNFIKKYALYDLEISDNKGGKVYPYSETKFLYLNSGSIAFTLKKIGGPIMENIEILQKTIEANVMLTMNLDVIADGLNDTKSGITIDTVSTWKSDSLVIGKIVNGDGSSKDKALLVDQLKQKIGLKGVWISGYIVGGDLTQSSVKFEAPFSSESNIAIAAEASIKDRTNCIAIALPSGDLRVMINLKNNPHHLRKRVFIKGNIIEDYFNLVGVNTITEIILE